MSFLTPLFLLGALAISLPVVFHLVRRTTRVRKKFSSLMFLVPAPPRLTRRSQIEHWLLMVLRCLALALLAFAFARPFIRDNSTALPLSSAPKDIVVLLDTSASMHREGLWLAARARVEAIVRQTSAVDRVAVLTFAREVTPLISFGEWTTAPPDARAVLAMERLASAKLSWAGTHLGEALVAAADALTDLEHEKTVASSREIVLISDLQGGSRLDTLQAYEWPPGISLRVEALSARTPGNAGVQLVAPSPGTENSGERAVRVRVTNAADSTTETFSVGWVRGGDGARVGTPMDAYVPPGQSRVLALPVPADAAGLDRIELRGDADPFDNTVFVASPEQQQVRVLYVGNEAVEDPKMPLYFLKRALPATASLRAELIARRSDAAISPDELDDAALFFITDSPAAGVIAALRAQVLAGKTIVVAPKSASAVAALGSLFEGSTLEAEEAQLSRYAMWGEIDFNHPLFVPFADPRFGDFTKISVWKYRRFDATKLMGSRVIARFDSGDPAMIEATVGKGRILLLACGWNPEDSQLAVSSKFVPLIWSLLELAGAVRPATTRFVVGDVIPIEKASGITRLLLPDGRALAVAAGSDRVEDTPQPGLYRAVGLKGEQRFVVNLDGNETRTEPLSLDELERLGVAMKAATTAAKGVRKDVPLPAVETESRQKLWRWFVGVTLIVLIVESILAGWTARRVATVEGAG